jgi:hypothetical protein
MLILSLVLSGIFVAILLSMTGSGEPPQKAKVVGWAFLGIPGGLFLCQSAPLSLNALLVFVVSVGGLFGGCGPQAFRRHIWLATAATYLILGYFSISSMSKINRLRERYPLESMAERLAYEKRDSVFGKLDQPLPEPTALRLGEIEHRLTDQTPSFHIMFGSAPDARNLEDLHKSYVYHFIDSPGFGVGRMIRSMDYRNLAYQSWDIEQHITLPPPAYDDPTREKDYRDPFVVGKPVATGLPHRDDLGRLHFDGQLDFVNQGKFGYVRDQTAVAGFKPHQFSKIPALERSVLWKLDTLELISLLKHAEPVAYVSRELPRMDKLREVPVRPLTEHERAMLDGLRRGEDLQVRSISDRLRMLGAIRAAEQCLRCHEVERGTLLGAFSYKLRLEQ